MAVRGKNARLLTAVTVTASLSLGAGIAGAQSNQFGSQDRSDAATRMTILAVQQGISSLPPTAGQSFTYEFDPEIQTSVRSEQLGATSFRSTQTVGDGKLSLRGAVSFFELSEEFGPNKYLVEADNGSATGMVGFGLKASAKATLINLAANYGIGNRFELMFNLPVVLTDTKASQIYSTPQSAPTAGEPQVGGSVLQGPLSDDPNEANQQRDALNQDYDYLLSDDCDPSVEDCLEYRSDSLGNVSPGFNDGSHTGIGRISVGAKYMFLDTEMADLAFSTELFFPSPNEEEFAGSESGAILPRLIGYFPVHKFFRMHADVGYDLDFDESELRRFVWNGGVSVPVSRFTFDAGCGGSMFDTPIEWTPATAKGTGGGFGALTLTDLSNNKLEDDYFDFLFGTKVRITDSMVLSASVTVPLTDAGFRADVVGTGAFEIYF